VISFTNPVLEALLLTWVIEPAYARIDIIDWPAPKNSPYPYLGDLPTTPHSIGFRTCSIRQKRLRRTLKDADTGSIRSYANTYAEGNTP
jgi:hypothetical protein